MPKEILAGSTDQTIDVFIQSTAVTTGAGLTGLVFNSASLVCYYRKGATGSATALTLATQTVGGAHSDGGFVEIDATNMPGMYRLDLSDTIVATAGLTKIMLKGATNMAPCVIEIEVVAVNKYDGTRMGLTALPNAAADAAGGLPISDAGGLDLDAKIGALTFTVAGDLDVNVQTWNGNTTEVTNITQVFSTGFATNYHLASNRWSVRLATCAVAAIDDAAFASDYHPAIVVDCQAALQSYHLDHFIASADPGSVVANSSFLAKLVSKSATPAFSSYDNTTDSLEANRDNIGTAGAGLTAIDLPDQTMNITGNLSGSVGSVTGAVGSVTGAVGSVTGNVGGNVVGSVASVTGNVGGNVTGSVGSVTGITASGVTLAAGTHNPQSGDSYARLGAPAGASVSADIAAVQADLPNRITKNTALAGFTFLMIDSTDHVTGKTGLTVTATRSIDGAAFGACANAVSEVSNGIYKIDLAAADLNGNVITLKFTATGADARFITIATQPT